MPEWLGAGDRAGRATRAAPLLAAGRRLRLNITSTAALRTVIYYIHANPVRHGTGPRAEDWEWSRARWYARLRPVKLEMDKGVLAELAKG